MKLLWNGNEFVFEHMKSIGVARIAQGQPELIALEIERRWNLVEEIEDDGSAAEVLAGYWIKSSGKTQHASDCATSCSPAMCPGPCDCDV